MSAARNNVTGAGVFICIIQFELGPDHRAPTPLNTCHPTCWMVGTLLRRAFALDQMPDSHHQLLRSLGSRSLPPTSPYVLGPTDGRDPSVRLVRSGPLADICMSSLCWVSRPHPCPLGFAQSPMARRCKRPAGQGPTRWPPPFKEPHLGGWTAAACAASQAGSSARQPSAARPSGQLAVTRRITRWRPRAQHLAQTP